MQLKEGKMSWRDLSIWFGLQPDSISKHKSTKENKLKKLQTFADYHLDEKGKLIIDRVIIPEYSKPYQIIEEEFPKRWGLIKNKDGTINETLKKERIDTCARVGAEIWWTIPEVKSQISIKTSKTYTNRAKRCFYGSNYKEEFGERGCCEYVWMNKEGTAPLDDKSLDVLKECANLAYNGVNLLLAAIDDDYKKGIISEEEYISAKGHLETSEGYERFVELAIQKLGFYPDKRTRLIDVIRFD